MTNKERLAKLICESMKEQGDSWSFSEIADYLIEHGVIVLPCKAGDIVYSNDLDPRFDVEIERIVIEENVITFEWVQYEKGYEVTECWDEGEFSLDDFGKTVFLTKEEAEQALKGHEGE